MPTSRDLTDSHLTAAEDLNLTCRALRCGWLIGKPGLIAKALEQIERVLDSEQASVRDEMLAAKVLISIAELERRIRRDDAEIESRREKRTISEVESALRSKDGMAAALERARLLSEALREQQQTPADPAPPS